MQKFNQVKRELRSSFQQRADLFQSHQAAFQVERLNENLVAYLSLKSGTWAAFHGTDHEPRLHKVISSCPHLRWIYPRMDGDHLVFVDSKTFATGKYGIEEPIGGTLVEAESISGYLVPGMAFDRQGHRLGRGKGYYDRALTGSKGQRIGVCFAFQIYEGLLPNESFDVNMHGIISDHGFIGFGPASGEYADAK